MKVECKMAIEFYDLKLKTKVNVDEANVKKVTYQTKGGTRYGVVAEVDGRKLTKFVGKADWDKLNVPQG